jgi:HEAT repeat protein
VKARALIALAERGDKERVLRFLEPAIRGPAPLKIAAARAIVQLRHGPGLGLLIALLDARPADEVTSAAIDALETLGDAAAEPVLLRLLGRDDLAPELRRAAIFALGSLATAAAVPILRAETGSDAVDAIRRIKRRIEIEPGGLSLAPGDATEGRLSVEDPAAGRVALAIPEVESSRVDSVGPESRISDSTEEGGRKKIPDPDR